MSWMLLSWWKWMAWIVWWTEEYRKKRILEVNYNWPRKSHRCSYEENAAKDRNNEAKWEARTLGSVLSFFATLIVTFWGALKVISYSFSRVPVRLPLWPNDSMSDSKGSREFLLTRKLLYQYLLSFQWHPISQFSGINGKEDLSSIK